MTNLLAAAVSSLVAWAATGIVGKEGFWPIVFLLVLSTASFYVARRFFDDLRPS